MASASLSVWIVASLVLGQESVDESDVVRSMWIGLIVISAIVLFFVYRIKKVQNDREDAMDQAGAVYQAALDHLAAAPSDPAVRVAALGAGRTYYGMAMRDTQILSFGSQVGPIRETSREAGREARIASDIEARVGHLKVQQG